MKPHQLHIYIDESMRDRLRDAANEATQNSPRVSMAEIARRALLEYFAKPGLLEACKRIENWLHYELSMLTDEQINKYNEDVNLLVAAIKKADPTWKQ